MAAMRIGLIGLSLACFFGDACAVTAGERRAVLDASRPLAADRAGQAVRIKVAHLNVDGDYAIIVGSLVGAPGKELNWQLAHDCHIDLDKMMWVVLRKQRGAWGVLEMEICASEPPYWYLDPTAGRALPCGVFAGLRAFEEETLEVACRRARRQLPSSRPKK